MTASNRKPAKKAPAEKASAKKNPASSKKAAKRPPQSGRRPKQEEKTTLTFKELLAKAKRGDARAIATLGGQLSEWIVDNAIPVEEGDIDEDAGEKMLRTLANRGNAEAELWLGRLIMRQRGWQGKEVDRETLDWWARAAHRGHVLASRDLARAYELGWGDAQLDFVEAAKWYRMGAERGDESSREALAELDALREKAERWSDKEAPELLWKNMTGAMEEGIVGNNSGDEHFARFVLGTLFLYGNDTVPPDLDRAADFLAPGKKAPTAKKPLKKERTRNIVEISVWTSDLGVLSVTPVARKHANGQAGEAPAGTYRFCNGNDGVKLTVKTGGAKKKNKTWANKLPLLEYGGLLSLFADYEVGPGEELTDEAIRESWGEIKAGEKWKREELNSQLELLHVWQSFHPGTLPEFMEKHEGFLAHLQSEAKRVNEMHGGEGVNFVQCGSIGKAKVDFEFELPEGEEFDIGKLHFLNEGDWWDGKPFHEEFYEAFYGKDVLLDFVVYDGRFHERTHGPSEASVEWRSRTGSLFLDNDLKELGNQERPANGDTKGTVVKIGSFGVPIGNEAYANREDLAEIELEEGIPKIGFRAFKGCTSLKSVVIPGSVASIEAGAFSGCTALESVVISEGVTEIGECAFVDCTSLESLAIPASVTKIDNSAFDGCTRLVKIEHAGSAYRFAGAAMLSGDGTKLLRWMGWLPAFSKNAQIPAGVTEIRAYAFAHIPFTSAYIPSLESVVIPEGVREIGPWAFQDCTSLKSVVIPGSVASIGFGAFRDCRALESVVILKGVTKIGWGVFEGCTSIKSVVIPEGVTEIEESMFKNCTALESVVILDGVTVIGQQAFKGCTSLESISIPASVTEIDPSAFENCPRLTKIEYSGPACRFEGGVMLSCDGTKLLRWAGGPPGCSKTAEIPAGVTEIVACAFQNCTSLESVVIPGGVAKIGQYAFGGCTSLKSVVIPEGVTEIGCGVFESCASLESVIIPAGVTAIRNKAFKGCASLESVVIPEGVTVIGNEAFKGAGLKTVTIPQSVQRFFSVKDVFERSFFAKDAFADCKKLVSARLPADLKVTKSSHFGGCDSLAKISRYRS